MRTWSDHLEPNSSIAVLLAEYWIFFLKIVKIILENCRIFEFFLKIVKMILKNCRIFDFFLKIVKTILENCRIFEFFSQNCENDIRKLQNI